MYFSRDDRGHFGTMVHNWPHDDVHVIVVTDGSRILGLGDLGAHGMGIPIGKLALYCAAGGIAPHRVLPVMLDVGTNNKALLEDDEYVGIRQPRLEGDEYFDMVDEFMAAVFARWPGVVVQFEDFETSKAVPLLAKYRNIYRVFNDDIQGTGCVALSGLMSAARNSGSKLTDMRILCAGAGSAGLGVCSQLVDGMVEAGLSRSEALSRFLVCTHLGALGAADGTHGDPNHQGGMYTEHVQPFMNPTVSDGTSLVDCAKQFKPTVLLGMTAQAKVFTEELVRTMATNCERPIIMPMSNPTTKAECSAEEGACVRCAVCHAGMCVYVSPLFLRVRSVPLDRRQGHCGDGQSVPSSDVPRRPHVPAVAMQQHVCLPGHRAGRVSGRCDPHHGPDDVPRRRGLHRLDERRGDRRGTHLPAHQAHSRGGAPGGCCRHRRGPQRQPRAQNQQQGPRRGHLNARGAENVLP